MSFDLGPLRELLGTLNETAVFIGIVVAALLYSKTQLEASYEKLNDRFLDFLSLQLAHPGLGTNTADRTPVSLEHDPKAEATRDLLFDYLCSLLERAYLFLHTGIDSVLPWKAAEWKSWDSWAREYARNPNFRVYWLRIADRCCYAPRFVAYMSRLVASEAAQPPTI